MNIKWVPNKTYNKDRVEDLLSKSLESNQFTNGGPVVKLLEETIRTKLKINDDKDIIPVCNGTVAIWVAISSIQLGSDKYLRWATQSFTFPPSAQGNLQDVLITDIDEEGGMELYDGLENQVDGIIVTNVFFYQKPCITSFLALCQHFLFFLFFSFEIITMREALTPRA